MEGKMRLLIVASNEEFFRKLNKLGKHYNVECVRSSSEAIATMREGSYEAVIVHSNLGLGSVSTVLDYTKRDGRISSFLVSDGDHRREAEEEGARFLFEEELFENSEKSRIW